MAELKFGVGSQNSRFKLQCCNGRWKKKSDKLNNNHNKNEVLIAKRAAGCTDRNARAVCRVVTATSCRQMQSAIRASSMLRRYSPISQTITYAVNA
jgi:hypothetical protein